MATATATYKQTLTWTEIRSVLKVRLHTILYGPPGTGKTRIANQDDQPYNITLTAETPAVELRGHFVPKGHQFEWHDGPAIRAWREGRPILRILAKGGRLVKTTLANYKFGNGNVVDGPALAWLSRQPGPRLWVCDGMVTGKGDGSFAGATGQAQAICKTAKIVRVDDAETAVSTMKQLMKVNR